MEAGTKCMGGVREPRKPGSGRLWNHVPQPISAYYFIRQLHFITFRNIDFETETLDCNTYIYNDNMDTG